MEKRIVEINGVKLEIDLRTATRVESFKIGDQVKVLVKQYGESYSSYFGVIVGFDEFKALPTIIVAYLNTESWGSGSPLRFVYLNSATKDTEICAQEPFDIGVEKSEVLAQFDREILKKETELKELEQKKKYFVEMFGRYFPEIEKEKVG